MSFRIVVLANSVPIEALINTGAAVSLLHTKVWTKLQNKGSLPQPLQKWAGLGLTGVNGNALSIKGCALIPVVVEGGKEFKVSFVITDDIMVDAILGLDFLGANSSVIDCGRRVLTFPSGEMSCSLTDVPVKIIGLVTSTMITIPAASEMEIMIQPKSPVGNGTWIVEGDYVGRHGVMVANAIVHSPRK